MRFSFLFILSPRTTVIFIFEILAKVMASAAAGYAARCHHETSIKGREPPCKPSASGRIQAGKSQPSSGNGRSVGVEKGALMTHSSGKPFDFVYSFLSRMQSSVRYPHSFPELPFKKSRNLEFHIYECNMCNSESRTGRGRSGKHVGTQDKPVPPVHTPLFRQCSHCDCILHLDTRNQRYISGVLTVCIAA